MPRKKKQDSPRASSGFKSLESILTSKDSPIDIKEVAYQLMGLVGGGAGLAQMIKAEYASTEAGSLARARALDLMVKMLQIASPKDGAEDTSYLTDDDIAETVRGEIQKLGISEAVWVYHVCI